MFVASYPCPFSVTTVLNKILFNLYFGTPFLGQPLSKMQTEIYISNVSLNSVQESV